MQKVQLQLDTEKQLSEIVFAPQENVADYYKRVVEIIDFIDGYFCMNICAEDAGEMTLNELRAILQAKEKIEFFSRFVATDKPGVFAVRDASE